MSTQVDQALVQQKVLIVVNKHEKALVLKELLRGFSAQVQVALSMTDAMASVKNSLPYLIICEHNLSDGDSFILQQKLKAELWFSKASMVVVFASRSDKDIDACKQRGMIPLLASQLDAKLITQLFAKLTQRHRYLSPFSWRVSEHVGVNARCTLGFSATIMGKLNGLIVVKSALIPSRANKVRCVPKDSQQSACVLSHGSSIQFGTGLFNLFPISQINGENLLWIGSLPELQIGNKNSATKSVIYVRSSIYNDQKYETLLPALGYQCVAAETWNAALEKFSKGGGQHKIILTTESPSAAVVEALGRLPENVRPVCLVVSTENKLSHDAFIRYVSLPFGFGTFAEVMEAASLRGDILEKANAQGSINGAGIPVTLQTEAVIHALDEIGGVVETPIAMHSPSEFEFVTFFDDELNRDIRKVSVSNIKSDANEPCFHIRFEARQMAMSQTQFLTRLSHAAALLKAS